MEGNPNSTTSILDSPSIQSSSLRVAYCIFGSKIHGAEKRVVKLALSENEFKREKIDSYLIMNLELLNSAKEDSELVNLINKNINDILIIADPPKGKVFRTFWLLAQLVKFQFRYHIDLFHVYLNARNVAMLLSFLGAKVIYEITSPDIADTFIRNYKKRKILYKRLFKINCVSKSVYNRIATQIPDPLVRNKVFFIDRPYISTDSIDPNQLLLKRNTIIYAARFIVRKNALMFAQIAKNILDEFYDWEVKIFGSGPQKQAIESILEKEIIQGRAFVGYTHNIKNEFKYSKVVVSLIEPDNYPSQSLFEAMAMGNALLVSNGGDSAKFICSNGIVSGDYEHDLRQMLNSGENLLQMGRNSISYFNQEFNETLYIKELVKLYEQ